MLQEMHNPDLFHGHLPWNKFEGWYFKVCDDTGLSFALIPGVLMESNHGCAFIQFLWGKDNKFEYFIKPAESFKADNSPFIISIEDCIFSFKGISVRLRNKSTVIEAELSFSNCIKWNPNGLSHNSMGLYNYIPYMECYSQVCCIDMKVSGHITVNGHTYSISNGRGYIEKNWGKAFPYSWIWIQSNSFKKGNTSLSASIAHIPFPVGSFRGFLIGFYHKGLFYSFTTINRANLRIEIYGSDIQLELKNRGYSLSIQANTNKGDFIQCKGPKNGQMIDMVRETLTAAVAVRLIENKSNKLIMEDEGFNAGIEYGGDYMKLLDGI